jgi:uroporphyrin-III C-methyltransferase/precorrin-2 dehydrogenase/sirohydrochlorin ferrochelatase
VRYLPIFVDLQDAAVVVSGGGPAIVAKLRLLLKTPARIIVFGSKPSAQIIEWANDGRLTLVRRPLEKNDATNARLFYAANDDPAEDARVADIGRSVGALVNVVDTPNNSSFITPAIVDRDPVVVAIGTEGTAPVLARRLRSEIEQRLSGNIGALARAGERFRPFVGQLPRGRDRRAFWTDFYEREGPAAWSTGRYTAVQGALDDLLQKYLSPGTTAASRVGRVWIVGAGPGDPELLTQKGRRALQNADVVIHDRLISDDVLDLARREATIIEVGKVPGGKSWPQEAIKELLVDHARTGGLVVRLKSGDPTIYGCLDEEMDALDDAGIDFEIVPGVTAATAAAARIKVSLTMHSRNSECRILTGQDVAGFAEHDWRALARPGAVAAIYMAVRAARFLQGRLLMHGAHHATPISIIENISRRNEKIIASNLGDLENDIAGHSVHGPAVIILGLIPRQAMSAIPAASARNRCGIPDRETAEAQS